MLPVNETSAAVKPVTSSLKVAVNWIGDACVLPAWPGALATTTAGGSSCSPTMSTRVLSADATYSSCVEVSTAAPRGPCPMMAVVRTASVTGSMTVTV